MAFLQRASVGIHSIITFASWEVFLAAVRRLYWNKTNLKAGISAETVRLSFDTSRLHLIHVYGGRKAGSVLRSDRAAQQTLPPVKRSMVTGQQQLPITAFIPNLDTTEDGSGLHLSVVTPLYTPSHPVSWTRPSTDAFSWHSSRFPSEPLFTPGFKPSQGILSTAGTETSARFVIHPGINKEDHFVDWVAWIYLNLALNYICFINVCTC